MCNRVKDAADIGPSMEDCTNLEFITSGQLSGNDYGCQLTSTANLSALIVVDALELGKESDRSEMAGQMLMLNVVSNAEVNTWFNRFKGNGTDLSETVG